MKKLFVFSVISAELLLIIFSPAKHVLVSFSPTDLTASVVKAKPKVILEEAPSAVESTDPYFWLNSGGRLYSLNKGTVQTITGELPPGDKWRELYKASSDIDTDGGLHPQNLFRLVSRPLLLDFSQQVYFNISDYHVSTSTNRNPSNGVLLFNRYLDGDNLYYTGVRVDGHAVIKKKLKGVYTTLAEKPYFTDMTYDRDLQPIVLPENTWMGIRSEIKTLEGGKVSIKLYIDKDGKGWPTTPDLEAIDDGTKGGKAILEKGSTGIRSDFMDVEFKGFTNYSL
jgi:hypothetical protein